VRQVPLRQRIQVVPVGAGIEHVGLEHGVLADAIQGDAVVAQHVAVILQVVPQLGAFRGLEPGAQALQGLLAIELRLGIRTLVRQGQVPGETGIDAEGEADDACLHVVQAGGLGVEGDECRGLQPFDQGIEFGTAAHDPVLRPRADVLLGGGCARVVARRVQVLQPAAEPEPRVHLVQGLGIGLAQGQLVLVDAEVHVAPDRHQFPRQGQLAAGRAQVLTHLAADVIRMRQHGIEAAVAVDPLRGGLGADLLHARHVVDAIADQGQEIDDLPRIDAELLADPGRVEDGAGHGVDQRHPVADQLRQVLVAGGDHDGLAAALGLRRQRRDHVVRLHPGDAQQRQSERPHQCMQRLHLHRQFLRHRRPVGLVLGIEVVAEGPPRGVEDHGHPARRIIRAQLAQHVGDSVQSAGGLAIGTGQRRQRVEGAVQVGRPVHQDQGGIIAHEVRRSGECLPVYCGPVRAATNRTRCPVAGPVVGIATGGRSYGKRMAW
jgi:hypothetical protein